MDSDCGGPTSGRVCDAARSRCVPGCRAAPGNGCPTSRLCSSTGVDIGVCEPMAVPPADGGVDGGMDGSAPDAPVTDGAAGSMGAGGAGGAPSDGAAGMTGAGGSSAGTKGSAGDDGENVGGYVAGGGCRCDATGSGNGSAGWLLLGVLLFVRRRRR
jgi:MYXO-CTERM domain-containing protein